MVIKQQDSFKYFVDFRPKCFTVYLVKPLAISTTVCGVSLRSRILFQMHLVHAFFSHDVNLSGPGCSKLTTSLVNETLNFQKLISQIWQYFLLKKCEKLLHCNAKASLIFSTKNFNVFGYKVVKHLTS